jgi:isoquinoline 1-oxidoreductase beta subunit
LAEPSGFDYNRAVADAVSVTVGAVREAVVPEADVPAEPKAAADVPAPATAAAPHDVPTTLGRRRFLGYAVVGSGLGVALTLADPRTEPAGAADQFAELFDFTDVMVLAGALFAHDFLIEIGPDNQIRLEVPRAELGQGITTSAAMMVAEELDVSLASINVGLSPAEPRRLTSQFTASSSSVATLWRPLRQVAALLRQQLLFLGSAQLGVAFDTVRTENGNVVAADGRSVPYGQLSTGVSGLDEWARLAQPKDPAQHRIVGQPTGRVDGRDIVTGQLTYAGDLDIADAVVAVIARPPTFGATVESFDPAPAQAVPGVLEVRQVPLGADGDTAGVAVLARTFGQAQRGVDALTVRWSPGVADGLSDADIVKQLADANDASPPWSPWFGPAVGGDFIFGAVAHAPMEPLSAVAQVVDDRVVVSTGAQSPLATQAKVARELGLPIERVEVRVLPVGGSFGQRLFFDAAVEAARLAWDSRRPVKLLYTRTQDMRSGRFRPQSVHRVQAAATRGWWGPSRIVNFDHQCATAELDFRHGVGDGITAVAGEIAPELFSQIFFRTSQAIHYRADSAAVELTERPFPMPTASWRSVYSGTANVANEIVVDELARALNQDELAFRLAHVEDERAGALLAEVARVGQWGRAMGPRQAQGLGLHLEYKSCVAVLAEVEYSPDPSVPLRVLAMTIGLDVNRVVNPTGLEAQAIGAATDAISTIITAGIHIDNGSVRESSYADYRIARMVDTPPEIEVFFMPPNGDDPGGAGEILVPAAGAAIANAFARATGIEVRRFPLHEHYPEG